MEELIAIKAGSSLIQMGSLPSPHPPQCSEIDELVLQSHRLREKVH